MILGQGPPSQYIEGEGKYVEGSFLPSNRKFLGSKHRLLPFIAGTLREVCPRPETFADLFAGTGVVSAAMNDPDTRVTAVDLLPHAGVILSAFLKSRPADLVRIPAMLDALNALPPRPGYYAEAYGGTYFTHDNAARIDAVRARIERLAATARESRLLLASLLLAADKVANTCGQYDAFLKHLERGRESDHHGGVHVVDRSVYQPLTLKPCAVDASANERNRVLVGDANRLARALGPIELCYLDPPYNGRQYCDNYHVLDNIALDTRSALAGKTRKSPREGLRSRYSTRDAAAALAELVDTLDARWIVLSYNCEGLLDDATIRAILSRRGPVERMVQAYPVFGRGAGVARRRDVEERLYVCRVRRRAT